MSEYIIDIGDAPRIGDVVETCGEIVRCRDCRHYHATYNGCDEFGDIWHDEYATVEPEGYCAWGARKVDA